MSLTMADKYHIKCLYKKEGLTYKEISKRTGHCYRKKTWSQKISVSKLAVHAPVH